MAAGWSGNTFHRSNKKKKNSDHRVNCGLFKRKHYSHHNLTKRHHQHLISFTVTVEMTKLAEGGGTSGARVSERLLLVPSISDGAFLKRAK